MKKPTSKQTRLFQAKVFPRKARQDKSISLHIAKASPERKYGELRLKVDVEQRCAQGD